VPKEQKLSRREEEILEELSKGYTTKEIASRFSISANTVHTHLKNIYEKLHVHSRTEAVLKFLG
jgi:DNA-binding NarL/FixJ family response regulator